MIRLATSDDIARIVKMGECFHAEAGWADISEFDVESCTATITNMIEQDAGIVVVVENEGRLVGMAGGVISPIYFNYAHQTGQELFFWLEPSSRSGDGRSLLKALEDEARAKGCKSWVMIALDKIRPEATGMLYKRNGYRPSEHSWIKRL